MDRGRAPRRPPPARPPARRSRTSGRSSWTRRARRRPPGTYTLQRATVAGGLQTFDIQQMMGGIEQRLNETTTIGGEIGLSRLDVSTIAGSRAGLAFHLSLVRRRKWWLIAPSVASVFVGIALVILLPKQYVSATTLGVSAPTESPTLVNLSISAGARRNHAHPGRLTTRKRDHEPYPGHSRQGPARRRRTPAVRRRRRRGLRRRPDAGHTSRAAGRAPAPSGAPARIVTGVRLDPRLVAESGDAVAAEQYRSAIIVLAGYRIARCANG